MLSSVFSQQVISRWHVLRLITLSLVVVTLSSVSTNKNVVAVVVVVVVAAAVVDVVVEIVKSFNKLVFQKSWATQSTQFKLKLAPVFTS